MDLIVEQAWKELDEHINNNNTNNTNNNNEVKNESKNETKKDDDKKRDNEKKHFVKKPGGKEKSDGKEIISVNSFENAFDRAKRRNLFSVAKENAENRLFKLVTLSPDDITSFFEIYKDDDGNGIAKRQEYSWQYKAEGAANVIPLDDYIVTPTKIVDGERKEIQFYVSFFFKDTHFLKKCKDYYAKYNIDFRIIKLKSQFMWKFICKVSDPKNIIFKADA